MTSVQLRRLLHSGKTVFGTLIVSPSPRWPKVVQRCGLDFVFIDTEHVAIDRHQLSWMCQTYASIGLPALVRIPSPDPFAATMALDGGASGIIAPYVESVDQVQALRGAVKMRPIKGEKLDALLSKEQANTALDNYIKKHAEDRILIVNIESTPALEALNDITAIPDLDAVLIGPHDLTCSLGIPEQYDHPLFLKTCATIFKQARAASLGAGIHFWGNVEQHVKFLELGANMLIHSADISLFEKYLRLELQDIRKALEQHNA